MKHLRTPLAVLLCALLLTCATFADGITESYTDENGHQIDVYESGRTVETYTDETGHTVQRVTDANGNVTVITETEPGEGDITFVDDGDLELEDDDAPESAAPASDAPDAAAQQQKAAAAQGSSPVIWIVLVAAAGCICAAWWVIRNRKKKS